MKSIIDKLLNGNQIKFKALLVGEWVLWAQSICASDVLCKMSIGCPYGCPIGQSIKP